jgi:SAM-dependent methyltransferase
MLESLLPHYTYRRLIVRLTYNWLRGRDSLKPRLNRENFDRFRQYRKATLNCNVCGANGEPFFDFPDLDLRRDHRIGELRETIQCNRCGSTMRHRTLVSAFLDSMGAALGTRFGNVRDLARHGLGGLRVLDTDAFSPLSRTLKSISGYTISSYRPELPMGSEIAPNYLNLDLERIDFPDATFDVVLTSDVMEHVRDIDAAHREIARILRTGGRCIFTIPYDPLCETHHVLVDTSGPENRFLVPPQYHGDPLTGGVLAYRVFGKAIFADLARVGLSTEFRKIDDDAALISQGDVFVATKDHGDV